MKCISQDIDGEFAKRRLNSRFWKTVAYSGVDLFMKNMIDGIKEIQRVESFDQSVAKNSSEVN